MSAHAAESIPRLICALSIHHPISLLRRESEPQLIFHFLQFCFHHRGVQAKR